ncbi:MAG: aspartate aminotransferase family protein [Vicinamibacterales bacterium]
MSYVTRESKRLFERALKVLVEGGSSPSRGPANYGDYPPFISSGRGSKLRDADGNEYIDWMMAYGALPFGHAHPRIVAAVAEAMSSGSLFAAASEVEIEVAELLQKVVPTAERVRFANTGTEAAMAAIRLARGYTGRPKFIKFEGHYHGWYDDFLVSAHPHLPTSLGHRRDPVPVPESSGLNRHALEDTILVPWNDLEALGRAIDNHRGQVAAIITEPVMANMGVIPPEPGYLAGLEEMARANKILFILDETVTGFRIAAGGCQAHYGLRPDICTFGKALGAGLPVAAFAGRAEVMEALAWGGVLHYGTQNASRVGLFAARESLRMMIEDNGEALRRTWATANDLVEGLRSVFAETGTRAIIQHVGPMLQVMFTERDAIRDYRDFCAFVDRPRYRRLALSLLAQGVYMSPSAALHSVASAVHSREDVAFTIEAVRKVLANAGR